MSFQTILITGATSGIGFEAAKQYVKQGWRVVFTGRDQERIASATARLRDDAHSPDQILGLLCDNANAQHYPALVSDIRHNVGTLDAVILNAGVFHPRHFSETTQSELMTTMSVNFTGPAMLLQALLPVLNDPCSVVYVSSIVVERAFPTASSYSASKAAFEAYANVLNLELAPQGVRINYLRPGVTATEIQSKAGMSEHQIDELNASLANLPLGRMLEPTEMLSSLEFLTSSSSLALRGAHITVDGGYCL
ncbi:MULTISPECIES: SDR family oxidoreductase [Vibrio]|jgi:NAD(P)-dependent dehydrogenase (short-subunit alcohol dehydrogenase family)|uniref:SDR family oxidoreductase n=1 Tax=Vibrio TaxID=662 RepID=UPI000307FF45|nr:MULTISPECIES: SDR family oxidoreductase [Vibrio]QFT39867.1 Bile acid 7-dehydroxylase 2 [Vibrio sp. THAF64]QGM37626.1 Bile acid 7-dehydroxylase 2 [Vibrio sp. THAF191d]QGN73349.1 Bile acid 7-dehydroxylase 2 [Vibrio sp. THAF191c]QXL80190.1 SDR family oxidoreductase [Vibrio sp.]